MGRFRVQPMPLSGVMFPATVGRVQGSDATLRHGAHGNVPRVPEPDQHSSGESDATLRHGAHGNEPPQAMPGIPSRSDATLRHGAHGNLETPMFRELTRRSDATLRHGAHGNNAITCETDSLAIPSPTPRCAMERMETLHSPWMRASRWRCPTPRCAMERMETIGRR